MQVLNGRVMWKSTGCTEEFDYFFFFFLNAGKLSEPPEIAMQQMYQNV